MTAPPPVSARVPAVRGRRPAGAESGREALLSAAMVAFARLGYEGSSLRALAATAGVDMALVARLFGSKAALWDAVVDRLARRQDEQADTLEALVAASREDPADAFRRLLRFLAELSLDMPAFPAFLLQEASNPGDRLETLLSRLVLPFRVRCRPIVAAAMDAGVVRGRDPDIVLGMIIASMSLPFVSPISFTGKRHAAEVLLDTLTDEAVALFAGGS